MIHDSKHLAIALTDIGLKASREYSFTQNLIKVEVYSISGVDGTDYHLVIDDGKVNKQTFANAWDASEAFADIIWQLIGV